MEPEFELEQMEFPFAEEIDYLSSFLSSSREDPGDDDQDNNRWETE